MQTKSNRAFSLVELLVVIGIIGILAGVVIAATSGARVKARDTKRKSDLAQIGRFIYASGCYLPGVGAGDYDLVEILDDFVLRYPQYANFSQSLPKDPKTATENEARYRYVVNSGGNNCALYANLESENEPITLPNISSATPGGGTGVFSALSSGWNGGRLFYQVAR